jgi:signal transduction histidine kinase
MEYAMFSERNIPRLIILTPIVTVILIALSTIYLFVTTQYRYFIEESILIEQEYLFKQKQILEREISSIIHYLEMHPNQHRSALLKYIESIRYEQNGYIWIHDTDYYLRAHPFRQNNIDTLDINLTDAMGTKITREFVNQTVQHPDGVFIEYYWIKPNTRESAKKIGFFRLYAPYNWVIGTGLYVDDIQNAIASKKQELEARVSKYIRQVVWVSLAVIVLIGLLSLLISRKINTVFGDYRDRVTRKEHMLQELNQNLEHRIDQALAEAQEKERAMLHQSRLARVGVMLSMIAHQWRQPLSEVSAILMELETAAKFKPIQHDMIAEAVAESNKHIAFMSHTIDDFRNFFKPDKTKVDFLISAACNEAISLADAAIRSAEIRLNKHIIQESTIHGYEREFAQVILNLITNAKDILIQRDIAHPTIDLTIDRKEEYVIVTVEDNGGGVREEDMGMIFEPYFTTKSSTKGTGLGLYISKMIIENNMGGELYVANTDAGARFTVRIACEH